jgi:NAD(P)-dependent dehydrogenase (short-subunit alcohol dehydrogenase family)
MANIGSCVNSGMKPISYGTPDMELAGKVAVVTGGSKGIGLAIVESLLARDAKVAAWSRKPQDMAVAEFAGIVCDVGDAASVASARDATLTALGGPIDILVNNAGIAYGGLLAEMNPDHWKQLFDVNVHGVFHCIQACLPYMKAGGHIVNIASLAGKTGIEKLSGYCATKFAVRGMSEALFKELRPRGIKVTCVLPGSVRTEIFSAAGMLPMPKNPLQPKDVADAVLHCLQASGNNLISEIEVRPFQP